MKSVWRNARIVVAVLALPLGAAAQDGGLEEIVVTAERREASLQDVPLAVSAFGREQLEDRQVTQAQDLQRYVPSLNMFNNITHPSNLSLSMRGGVVQDASIVAAESPIGIYVDDIYVGRLSSNNASLADIERIEVLRGPQGTLYGRNTSYGALKYISRTPGEEVWFNAEAGVGNDEQQLFSASVGGPLNDAWAGSLAARWFSKDEQYTNVATGEETGNEENLSFRAKLRYMGGEKFDAVASITHSSAENDSIQLVNATTPNNAIPGNCPSVLGRPCGPGEVGQFSSDDLVFTNGPRAVNTATTQLAPSPLGNRPQAETDQTVFGLTLSYDISDNLTFRSITGFVNVEDDWHNDFNGNTAVQPGFTGATTSSSDQFSQEFQLLGTAMDDRLSFLAGAYYLTEDADQTLGWHFVLPLSTSVIDTELDSIAVFADATYNFTDRFRATAGIRWTEDDKNFTFDFERLAGNFFEIVIGPFLGATTELIPLDGNFSEVTPRLVLEYTLDDLGPFDSGIAYFQVAEGFKAGGFSAISIVTTEAVGVYDPDTNTTYEVGLKADWLDSRLRTNLAYFFSDVNDIQQNSTNPTGAGLEFPVGNIGDVEVQGLEAEISFVPTDGLRLFLTGTFFMDGEYKNLNPLGSAFQAPALYGVEAVPPQTADFSYSIGGDYTFDFPGDLIGNVSIGIDRYEIDEYITASTNDFLNAGWDQWNAYIRADIGDNWEVKLAGRNLGDEDNVTSGSRGLGGFIVGPPQEVLFTVSYQLQ